MYCRKKLNEGEEKGPGRLSAAACLLSTAEKKNSPSQKNGDGGIEKRSGRVKRDSKRELLTLDPGCMILKAAEFAHRISYSWKLSALLLSQSCNNFEHKCKAESS